MGDQNPVKTGSGTPVPAQSTTALRTWLDPQRREARARMREAMDRFWTDYYKDAVK